jgi:hypothetical protein
MLFTPSLGKDRYLYRHKTRIIGLFFFFVQSSQVQIQRLLLLGLGFSWYEFSWEPTFLAETTLFYWSLYNGFARVDLVSTNKVFDSLSPSGIKFEALSRSFPREDFTFDT